MSVDLRAVAKPTAEDIFASAEEKQLWQNVTRKDIMNYYISVAKYILPHITEKVQSLRRDDFVKDDGPLETITNMRGPWEQWVRTENIYLASSDETKPYIICNDVETLLYLNTIGCIEINPWLSKYYIIDKPDYMVIDLDPSEDNTFEDVIQAALVVKSILDKANVKGYIKTSGSTGLHIYIGVGGQYDYSEVRKVAQRIAELTVQALPKITTTERRLAVRGKDKIYVDFMQNKRGATLASVYSVRPRKEPYVSMPLEWDEVKAGLYPSHFTIHNALKRIEKVGDIFNPVLTDRTDIRKMLNNLS